MAQLRTKAGDVGERINALPRGSQPNNILVASIQREIEGLKHSNISEHYMMKGILNAKLVRKNLCVESFESAINSNPGQPIIRYNFGVALQTLGCLYSALEQFEKCLAVSFDYDALIPALDICLFLGDVGKFKDLIAKFIAAHPEKRSELEEKLEDIKFLEEDLKQLEISQKEFSAFMCEAARVLEAHEGFFVHFGRRVNEFGSEPYLYVNVLLNKSAKELAAMNEELLTALIGKDIHLFDKVILSFCYDEQDGNKSVSAA